MLKLESSLTVFILPVEFEGVVNFAFFFFGCEPEPDGFVDGI